MSRSRTLARLVQDQTRLLYNQEKENAWHCRILRATAGPGQEFRISAPEWHDQAFLVTARDLGKHRSIRFFRDSFPIMADRVVEHPGQVIGLVIAPTSQRLVECEQQVQVQYAPPPALANGPEESWHCRRIVRLGDPLAVLDGSLRSVSSHQVWQPREYHQYEPRGAIAEWKSDMLWVQVSTVWPHLVRRLISESTGLPQKNITVIAQPAGTLTERFLIDAAYLACYASMAALTCMKQVQLFLSAIEDRRFGTALSAVEAQFTTLHGPDGRIASLRALVEIDGGAWPLGSQETMQSCLAALCSSYRIPHQDIEIRLLKTAKPPSLASDNFGLSAMQHLLERHLSAAFERLDLDGVSLRGEQLLNRGDPTPFGVNQEQPQAARLVLEHVAQVSDYRRSHDALELLLRKPGHKPRWRGVGLALAFQSHGLLTSLELANRPRLRLRWQPDGHLMVHAPLISHHGGLIERWTQELAEQLGIEPRQVSFGRFSTDQVDDSGPGQYSRLVSLYSPLLSQAARLLRQRQHRGRAETEVKLSWANTRRLKWDEDNFSGTPFLGRSWAAASVKLRLDTVQALPLVEAVWITIHAGAILNPPQAQQAIEQAVRETIAAQGALMVRSLPIRVEFLGHERFLTSELAFNHAGGIGELVNASLPAALASAASQALGHAPVSLPFNALALSALLDGLAEGQAPQAEAELDQELQELLS